MKMLYKPKRLRAGPNVEMEFAIFLTTVLENTPFSITKSARVELSVETIQRAKYGTPERKACKKLFICAVTIGIKITDLAF